MGVGLGAGADDDDLVGVGSGPGALLDELCVVDGVLLVPLAGLVLAPGALGDWLAVPWRPGDGVPLGLAEGLAPGLEDGVAGDVAAVAVVADA